MDKLFYNYIFVLFKLSNDLTLKLPDNIRLITEGSGDSVKYYAQLGADAASKKLLGSNAKLLWINPSVQSQATIIATCDWSKYDKIIILLCQYCETPSNNKSIQCCDISITTEGWSINSKAQMYRTVKFNPGNITMYVTNEQSTHNWQSYNIPLKIWGMNTEEDFYSYP